MYCSRNVRVGSRELGVQEHNSAALLLYAGDWYAGACRPLKNHIPNQIQIPNCGKVPDLLSNLAAGGQGLPKFNNSHSKRENKLIESYFVASKCCTRRSASQILLSLFDMQNRSCEHIHSHSYSHACVQMHFRIVLVLF